MTDSLADALALIGGGPPHPHLETAAVAREVATRKSLVPPEADVLYRRVRQSEGTAEGSGFVMYGGKPFTPGPEHPGAAVRVPGPQGPTSAAGPGQWEEGTWNGLKPEFEARFGRPAVFSSDEDQKAMVWLDASRRYGPDLAADIRADRLNTSKLSQEWPSFGTSRGREVVAAKRQGTVEDAADLLRVRPGEETEPTHTTTTVTDPETGGHVGPADPADISQMSATSRAAIAAITGVRRGMQSLVTGPIQAVAEQVAPEWAKTFTSRINEMEEQFEPAVRQHPYLTLSGEVAGTVLGILVGGGLIGAGAKGVAAAVQTPAIVAKLLESAAALPSVVRGAAGGAALGATQYNPDPRSASRLEEGVLGAGFGTLGALYGKLVGRTMRTTADRNMQTGILQAAKGEAERVGASTSAAHDTFWRHYEAMEARKTAEYGGRNAAGREIEDGFSYDPMKEATDTAMAQSQKQGVPALVRGTVQDVRRELGVTEQEIERAKAETAAQEWAKKHAARVPTIPGVSREDMFAQYAAAGRIPPPPEPWLPKGVRPEQYEAADTLLSRAVTRAIRAKDVASRTQLEGLKRELRGAAEADASVNGWKYERFLQRSKDADTFMRETIVPLRDAFDGRTARQLKPDPANPARGLTGAQFYDKVVRMVEEGDREHLPQFAKILGPRGKEMMRDVLLHRAVTRAEKPDGTIDVKALIGYATDPKIRESTEVLFGSDGAKVVQGLVKISARLAQSPLRGHGLLTSGSSWLTIIGLEHAIRGDVLGGATLAASGFGAHALYDVIRRIHGDPLVNKIAARAAHLRPDSPQLDHAIRAIETRVRRMGVASGVQAGAGLAGGNRRYVPRDRPMEFTIPPQ